ncbi:MAG: hypothetical protein ACRCW2_10260 [Cellulosilyticaceae bacterium]
MRSLKYWCLGILLVILLTLIGWSYSEMKTAPVDTTQTTMTTSGANTTTLEAELQ